MPLYSIIEGAGDGSTTENGIPNVSQYGWSSYEVSEYKQLIEYVDEARKYAESIKGVAEFVLVVQQAIIQLKAEVDAMAEDLRLDYAKAQELYAEIKVYHTQIVEIDSRVTALAQQVAIDAADVKSILAQVTTLRNEVRTLKASVDTSERNAASSATAAQVAETGAEDYFNKSYDLYLDLKKGQVYRGPWNPNSGAYPTDKTTNSVWDVVLNPNQQEHTFDGKRWFWGDRLVYVKDENKFYQIEAGTSVKSVNGKAGAVVLTATDVGAVSKTGDTMTGDLTITKVDGKIKFATNVDNSRSGFEFTNTANQNMIVEHIISDAGIPLAGQGLKFRNTGDAQHIVHLITDGELFARNDKKVYHTGNNPTATDVGALPNTGGTVTGPINIHAAASHLTLRETDQSNKEWCIEGVNGDLRILETGVSSRATFKVGGGTELSGTLLNNGEVKSKASNSYRMFSGTDSSNIGSFFRNDNHHFYLMFTNAGEAEGGTWNNLRPFQADIRTGQVSIGNGLIVNSGLTSTSYMWVDSGASANPINGVKRGSRSLYMFDTGTWTGLFSAGVTGKSDNYLIRRSTTVGNIVIGHGGTDLSVDASTFKYNNSPILTESTLTGKAIGAAKALSTEDLDTLKTAGVFSQSANSNATAARHYPEDLAGSLMVTVSAGVEQRYHVYNTSRIWTRAQHGSGGWTAWAREYNTLNKPTTEELGFGEESPLPDVWIPFNDSLRMITGFGEYDRVYIGDQYLELNSRSASFERATTATYVDKSGVLRTAAINEPRFEKQGLLIEGQSANLTFPSERWPASAIAAAPWVHSDADSYGFITVSGSGSPTGGEGSYRDFKVPKEDTPYTFSMDIAKSENLNVRIRAYGYGGSGAVDISIAGSVVSGAGASSVTDMGSYWRIIVTRTFTGNTRLFRIYPFGPNIGAKGSLSYRRVQLEELPLASSYIPTTDSAVTRAADRCWVKAYGNIPTGDYTVAHSVNIGWDNKNKPNPAPRMIRLRSPVDGSSFTVETQINGDGSFKAFCTGDTTGAMINGIRPGSAIIFSAKGKKLIAYADGRKVESGDLDLVGAHSEIVFGDTLDGTRALFGHIRNFRVWHRVLSDAQIKSLR